MNGGQDGRDLSFWEDGEQFTGIRPVPDYRPPYWYLDTSFETAPDADDPCQRCSINMFFQVHTLHQALASQPTPSTRQRP